MTLRFGLEEAPQDPTYFPSEIPQVIPNAIQKEFERPTEEFQANKAKAERDATIRKVNSVKDGVFGFDAFEPTLSTAAKKRKLIRNYIEAKTGQQITNDVNEYAQIRNTFAVQNYNGKGGNNDDAFYGEMQREFDVQKTNDDMHVSLQDFAFQSSLDGRPINDWVKRHPKMSPERQEAWQFAYKDYKRQIADQYGEKVLTYNKNAFTALKNKSASDSLDYLAKIAKDLDSEEQTNLISLFFETLHNNPDTIESFSEMIGLPDPLLKTQGNVKRSLLDLGDLVRRTPGGFADFVRGGETYGFAKFFGSEEAAGREKERAMEDKLLAASIVRNKNFVTDLRTALKDWKTPSRPVFEGALGAVESGVYASPSVLYSLALGFLPRIGAPLMASTMYGASKESYRQNILAGGIASRDQAEEFSGALGMIGAAPMYFSEKLKWVAIAGKAPMFQTLFNKINNVVGNSAARLTARFAIANVGETNIEMGQEVLEAFVQDMGSIYSKYIPGVNWKDGENGVFDGYAYKYIESMVAMTPFGVTASVGGINKETRAEVFASTPRQVRTMSGVTDADNDRIDKAETIAQKVEAVGIAQANADPNSPQAKQEVDRYVAQQQLETKALSDLQRAGLFPLIQVSQEKQGVVEIVDPETGDVVNRIDNSSTGVAEAVFAYMELQDDVNQDRIDELAGMVDIAVESLKESKDPDKITLELGKAMDVQGLLAEFPQYADRVRAQVSRLENLENKEIVNGGDGGISRAVYGINEAQNENDVKSYNTRIYGRTTAWSLIHEHGHKAFKRALDSGALTLKEAYDFFQKLDKSLEGKTDRKGNKVRFLTKGVKADDYVAIDEAVAEFTEVMMLRSKNGKKTEMRQLVDKQLSAMVKARIGAAPKLKSFYDAMMELFSKVFARNFYFKQAIRRGEISEAELNNFMDLLAGTTQETLAQSEAQDQAMEILDVKPDADVSLSIGDTQMKDTLITNAISRVRDPDAVATVMKSIIDKITKLKRDVPELIQAFGKEYVRQPIVEKRLIGELRAQARDQRFADVEAAENEVYSKYGDILDNADLTQLKAQPVTEFILTEGGLESLSSAKRRMGDDSLLGGEYESAAGLPSLYYGGTQSPDQMALQLFNDGLIKDPEVETMIDAVDRDMISVSKRKEDFKAAKKIMSKARKEAKEKADTWLNERIAEQQRDYNPMERARRALVMLNAIRMSLPMELRGKISGDIQKLTTGSDEKRLEYLEETLKKVDKVVDDWVRKETKSSINKLVGRVKKRIKAGKSTPETATEIEAIEQYGAMTKVQVEKAISKTIDAIDEAGASEKPDVDKISKLNEELVFLSGYGARDSMSSLQLVQLLKNIYALDTKGKTIRQLAIDERKDIDKGNRDMVVNDVSGGKGQMSDRESAQVRKENKKTLNKFKSGIGKFHKQNVSFEWLLNGLARNNKEVGTLESKTHQKFATDVHVATRKEKEANQQLTKNYGSFMSSVFGKKGIRLASKIAKDMMEAVDTGVTKMVYDGGRATTNMEAEASVIKNVIDGKVEPESVGLNKRDVELAKESYNEALQKKRLLKKNKGKTVDSLPDSLKIKWKHENKGKKEEMLKSQSEAIALVMMFRQEGIKQSMIMEGYTEDAMKKLEEKFLTKESRQIMDWLSSEYEKNYDVVNEVYRRQNGVDLPKIEFYAPVRRMAGLKEGEEIGVDGSSPDILSTNPSFFISRVTNNVKIDQKADALSMFMNHMHQSNHYVAWSDTIRELRSTFGNAEVRKAIEDYSGVEMLKLLDERIQWLADGANRKAWNEKWLNKVRIAHTYTSLGYNLGIALKQLTSLPAYAYDMGLKDWIKYQTLFFENPIENWKEMSKLAYVKTRFSQGYERDAVEALRGEGSNNYERWLKKGLNTGMFFGKAGDIVPVIVGGWAAKRRAYDKARLEGMSKKQAEAHSITVFEMTTDRAQQAVDMKDFSTLQAGGSLAKLFTMYKTSPRQYYANSMEALLDAFAGKKGATKGALNRMAISHMILPFMFQMATDVWKKVTDDEDDPHEIDPMDYLRAMLLGPMNGLYIAGDVLFSPLAALATGTKVWDPDLPIFQSATHVFRATKQFESRGFAYGVNELAESIGKIYPTPITYYAIAKRRLEDFLDLDD